MNPSPSVKRPPGRRGVNARTAVLGAAALLAAGALIWGAVRYRDALRGRLTAPVGRPPAAKAATAAPGAAQLYFADGEYTALAAEPRDLPAATTPEERVHGVVAALIAGPRDPAHSPTLPADCKLESVFIRDRVAILNFDARLRSPRFGTTGELFALNSVWRTVTANVAGVDGVVIMVDGRMNQTLAGDGGHVACGFPLYGELGRYVAPPPKAVK